MTEDKTRLLFDELLRSKDAVSLFSDRQTVQYMLDFEAALARAESKLGVIPFEAASVIQDCCSAALFDFEKLRGGAAISGNIAIPLVKQLTAVVRERSPEAAGYVHWGATSQDVIDTGCILQLRGAFLLLQRSLRTLAAELTCMTEHHATTLMAGRTWLQHAVPITLGLKTAGYLDAILRHLDRVRLLLPRLLTLQFGGAAGTLAALDTQGLEIAAALATELDLACPASPWHGHSDRLVEAATTQGLLIGTLGKIARDLALMGQTEIQEATPRSTGGSSTMPHKRNPVALASILSSALRVPGLVGTMLSAMVQEHERGLGGWQAGWETLPEVCMLTLGATERLIEVLRQLQVDESAIHHNLERTGGFMMAEAVSMSLAKKMGRDQAHALMEQLVHEAVQQGISLRSRLANDPQVVSYLSSAELDALLDPAAYLGGTSRIIAAVLERYRSSVYCEADDAIART